MLGIDILFHPVQLVLDNKSYKLRSEITEYPEKSQTMLKYCHLDTFLWDTTA